MPIILVMIWLILLMGVVLLCACFMLPREIGREEEPLTNIRIKRPDIEGLALRLSQRQRPHPRPRPAVVTPPPPAPAADAPTAMGAAQPVLAEDPSPLGLGFPRQ